MNNQHAIEEMVFDISFSAEEQAFAEQARLGDFVAKSLLGEVENVFDEYANEHEILRIDRLEIDLGVLPYQDYPNEMVARLGVQLRDRLRKLLADYRSDIRVGTSGGVGSVTRHEVTLEIFEYFMRHGAFPWHYRALSLKETQNIFSHLIKTQTDAVIRLLYQVGSPADVSIRLVAILPFDDVMAFVKCLLHKRFSSLSLLIAIMVDAHLDHGWLLSDREKGRDASFQNLWRVMLEILLLPATRESTVNTLSVALIKKVVRNENISIGTFGRYLADKIDHSSSQLVERDQLREMLLSLQEQSELADQHVPTVSEILLLLVQCNREELREWWHKMLANHSDAELMAALKNLFLYASGRERLIETCSAAMLYDWCEYLAPAQIDYLKLCGAAFEEAAVIMGLTKQQAIDDFWGQTLLYYGSYEHEKFSQKDFLNYLLRGRGDAFRVNMLNALEVSIQEQTDSYDFCAMIKELVAQQLDMTAVTDSPMAVEGVHLSEWIPGCDTQGLRIINSQWDEILQRHAALLKRLVVIHAPRYLVRRALVNELSFEQLKDLTGLIDPAAKEFVDDVVRLICRALVASNLVDVNKLPLQGRMLRLNDEHTLWGFTFDFVLVERGSRFNKKAYCSALLREMSAHNNCSYRTLLDVMQQWFSRLSVENSYARDILSILHELCENFDVEPLRVSAEEIIPMNSPFVKDGLDRVFILKVLSQDRPLTDDAAAYLQTMISGFINNAGIQDNACLSGLLGDEVKVRRLISYVSNTQFKQLFSVEQLKDLTGLIDPAAKEFVEDTVRLICRALVASNLVDVSKLPLQGRMLRLNDEHTLWGFTFDFVLVERGSRFNKKAYCSTLLREMSAHNNCSYRVLLDVMQQWFSRLSAENSYARDVLSILHELCEDFDVEPLYVSAETITQTSSPLVKSGLDRDFLLKVLSQEPPLTDDAAVYLQTMISGFIKNSGVQDSACLSGLLGDEVKARRLISYVSTAQFKRLLSVSGGERYRSLYPHAELLFNGIAYDMDSDASAKLCVEWLVFCCRYIYSGPLVSPTVFIKLLTDYLLSRSAQDAEIVVPRLALFIERKKSDALTHVVLDSVKQLFFKEEILAKADISTRAVESGSVSKVSRDRYELAKKPAEIGDAVYIRNAGLVLLAPYLSTLFERLKLLQHNQFISAYASAHAVHIMQYMADGVGEAPEYMMVLNKLMCGIATAQPVVKDVLISDDEKAMINGLLSAVIGNWKGIGNTTVDGLRESFLAREGRLTFKNDQWQLLVESRSYDMLLDSLPWSYAMIKYSWMPHVINVAWR